MTEQSTTSSGRIAAIVAGVLLALVGLTLALGGAALVVADTWLEDDDGFLTMPYTQVESSGSVLLSEPFEIEDIGSWPFDEQIRVRATVDDSSEPVFIGIAPEATVESVLQGVAGHRVTGFDPWGDVDYEPLTGGQLDTPPAGLVEWDQYAVGAGPQQLTWQPHDGDWVAALLNADGSAGVDARVRVGVDLPHFEAVAWSLLGLGVLIGLLAAALIAIGARRGGSGADRDGGDRAEPAGVAASTAPTARPGEISVTAAIDEPISRGLWLVKWLLLLPHYVVLALLWTAVVVVTIVAWFAIVLTGRYPRPLFAFVHGVARWTWRVQVYGYGALSTDRYPPFTLGDAPDYPARLHLEPSERLSRALPFVKWVFALPHLLLAGAISGGVVATTDGDAHSQLGLVTVLVLIVAGGLLFQGRLPRGVFDLLVGIQRWGWRVFAYAALLSDEYPPFRLDQGGEQPRRAPSTSST